MAASETTPSKIGSEAQGQRFEDTFAALLKTLFEVDLGHMMFQLSQQPRGAQAGKDIQVRWLSRAGDERFWHFECKSHTGATLPTKDVADKLASISRSAHDIDVWCLVLSDAEPSVDLDEFLPSEAKRLSLPCSVAVLSPQRNFIKELYACHPDLYRQQYEAEPPVLSAPRRRLAIDRFAVWLERQSRRPVPRGWERIEAGALRGLPDDREEARAYLRGMTPSCPWEAIVHRWAVDRPSAEEPMIEVARTSSPGVHYHWLVGAGGEGKSTVLRRVAWRLVTETPETIVLWAGNEAEVPVEWLKALPRGTRVVLFVDDTRTFSSPPGLGEDRAWVSDDKTVVLLLADRGVTWRRQRGNVLPRRHSRTPAKLGPMTDVERSALVEVLRQREMLHTEPGAARERLRLAAQALETDLAQKRAERAWLVPTLMRLTDPEDRPFELILLSVLTDLRDENETDALLVLLATALVHAAGWGLPQDLAERIAGGPKAWSDAQDTLAGELESQLGVSLTRGASEYRTHGAAVSAGFVDAAARDELLADVLSLAGRELVAATQPDYSANELLPRDRFDLLDAVVVYLDEVRLFRVAVDVLKAWVALDTKRGFPAMQRLGTAYQRWLSAERGTSDFDVEELVGLLEAGRRAYRDSLRCAREVLTAASRPRPYEGYTRAVEEAFVYGGWAFLELTAADASRKQLREEANLMCALYLSLVGAAASGRTQSLCLGAMANVLRALGHHDVAASVLAVYKETPRANGDSLRRWRTQLEPRGRELPDFTPDLLPAAVAASLGELEARLDEIGVESGQAAHLQKLEKAIAALRRESESELWPA